MFLPLAWFTSLFRRTIHSMWIFNCFEQFTTRTRNAPRCATLRKVRKTAQSAQQCAKCALTPRLRAIRRQIPRSTQISSIRVVITSLANFNFTVSLFQCMIVNFIIDYLNAIRAASICWNRTTCHAWQFNKIIFDFVIYMYRWFQKLESRGTKLRFPTVTLPAKWDIFFRSFISSKAVCDLVCLSFFYFFILFLMIHVASVCWNSTSSCSDRVQ